METEEEKEEGDERENEQVQFESPIQERPQRQRSLSPIWNLFPKDRDYNQEHAEGSKQQGNGKEIIEMLREMRQEMKERDKQMKLQL